MSKAKYYQLANDGYTVKLYIFGDIRACPYKEKGEQSGYSVVRELQRIKADKIDVHINSYGGEVAEGLAIYNTLRDSGKDVTTYCDGFACSAASIVFMAGSRRVMSEASLLMIHNAALLAYGDAAQLRKQADDIETITQASINVYTSVSGMNESIIKPLMDAETWILPDKALEMGFATEIDRAEESGKATQSAFRLIAARLTAQRTGSSADEIAEAVVARLRETQKPQPKEEQAGRCSGILAYFLRSTPPVK